MSKRSVKHALTNEPVGRAALEGSADLPTKLMQCLSKAFDAIGASKATQQTIFQSLLENKKLGQEEIVDKPTEFFEELKKIMGEGSVKLFQYMLSREMKKEFGLDAPISGENVIGMFYAVANRTMPMGTVKSYMAYLGAHDGL